MENSLEVLFDGEEQAAEVVETEEPVTEPTGEGETQVAEAQEEPESETDEPKEEVASPAPDDSATGLLAAMHGERDRRKAAERENAELKERIETADKIEPTSVFEDEAKFRDEIRAEIGQSKINTKLELSEFYARDKFGSEKVDAAIEKYKQLATENPELKTRATNAVSPFHEIVNIVERAEKLAKLDNVEELEKEIEARVRAELTETIKGEAAEKQKTRDSIPKSLASSKSSGGLSSSSYSGPTPLESLID